MLNTAVFAAASAARVTGIYATTARLPGVSARDLAMRAAGRQTGGDPVQRSVARMDRVLATGEFDNMRLD